MIDKNYNEKFRNFFQKFEKNYVLLKNKDEQKYLFDLAVDFVEKNRDFVMQYPLVQYWEDIDKTKYCEIKKELLSQYQDKNVNLYFHIPFCKTKCTYCNFHIITWDKNKYLMEKIYIKKLKKEIDEFLEFNKKFTIDTIFIGWWTPSYLSEDSLEDLLSYIQNKFSRFYSKKIEFTFEWNPDSFDTEKLKILKKYNVNRLSIWVQTFENEILKAINRTYTDKIIYKTIELVKKSWFKNINVDMIYGLPWANYLNMKSDLDKISSLDVTHITYYPLYYYDNSILTVAWKKQNNIADIYNFYNEVVAKLREKWFKQYWREYFCKNNKIHNYQNNFVSNKILYGFWHSAYSFNSKTAFYKEQNLQEYLKKEDNIVKFYKYSEEILDKRLFVLWSRNIKILKVNIKNIEYIRNSLKLPISLWLITEKGNYFILTKLGLKYQEVLAHMIV